MKDEGIEHKGQKRFLARYLLTVTSCLLAVCLFPTPD